MATPDLVVMLALSAGACWLAVRAFERPEGVYVKSLIGAALAIGGGLGLLALVSPLLGSGAGLGVTLIYLAFVALVAGMDTHAYAIAVEELARGAVGAAPATN